MKINRLPVDSYLIELESGKITGWFELPSEPHTRYAISFNADEMCLLQEPPEEETQTEETPPGYDHQAPLVPIPENPIPENPQETVQLPDGSVAPVDLGDASPPADEPPVITPVIPQE